MCNLLTSECGKHLEVGDSDSKMEAYPNVTEEIISKCHSTTTMGPKDPRTQGLLTFMLLINKLSKIK